jgi:hypothetical protein
MQGESPIARSLEKLRNTTGSSTPTSSRGGARYDISFSNKESTHELKASSALNFLEIESSRVAGRLSAYKSNWLLLTSNERVLRAVSGYYLPFHRRPAPASLSPGAPKYSEALNLELEQLRAKGVIRRSNPTQLMGWMNSIFGVPKPDGSTRPIINLRPLNKFLTAPHFKMEHVGLLRDIARPGDYCCKIDMKDAYYAIRIDPSDRPYLSFCWGGEVFHFVCLPFGLSSAPFIYSKCMRQIAKYLRSLGIRLIHYLDDWLLLNQDADALQLQINLVLSTFDRLGLRVNVEKSVITPTQVITFLGLEFNSSSFTLALPADKLLRLGGMARSLLQKEVIPIFELESFIGLANFATQCCNISTLFLRNLQRTLTRALHESSNDRTCSAIHLTLTDRADLQWWSTISHELFTNSCKRFSPDTTITSDASKAGWGAVCMGMRTGGRWASDETTAHINTLELRAARFGLMSFATKWRDTSVLLELDNTTAVSYINRLGGTCSPATSEEAKALLLWANDRNISIRATHRPGCDNVEADYESRVFLTDELELSLSECAFNWIVTQLGSNDIDLFASRLNHKLPIYYSYRPDPLASRVDAFAQSWSEISGFAFPPWTLIGRTVAKALNDQAHLTIVTPNWTTQSWFPILAAAACSPPLEIPMSPMVLLDHRGGAHPLLAQPQFRLLAWRICGISGSCKACLTHP